MIQTFNLQDMAKVVRARKRMLGDNLRFFNPIKMEQWRNGRLFKTISGLNDITNVGKNKIFDVMFNDGTPIANNSWFIGLISNAGYTAVAATDTMASHAGWAEFTSYDQATRVAWGSGAAASQTVTNASPATFNISATGTLKGIFVVSNSTKSGTTGTLWSTALFSTDTAVADDDELRISYTLSA